MITERLGVVVPVYNEEGCLPELRRRLDAALEPLTHRYDVYLIDDGSTDGSARLIRQFATEDHRWHGVLLARNFGHQAAITAGLRIVTGDFVIVMDADLQDEPESISKLIAAARSGYDVVYARRRGRKEGLARRAAYWLYYRILYTLTRGEIPADAGDFCLMTRRVVEAVNAMPENNRFVRGLRAWVGFRQVGIDVERGTRSAGDTKYTLTKLFRLAFDGIFDFSLAPLRFASLAGMLSVAAATVYLAIVVTMKLLGKIEIQGWTTVVFLVSAFGGMILISLGVIGEYIGRIYIEVKRRPTAIIDAVTTNVISRERDVLKRQNSLSHALIVPESPEVSANPVPATRGGNDE